MVQLKTDRAAMAKGRSKRLAAAVAGFLTIVVVVGAPAAHAGTNGQQLSLHDVAGYYNSARVDGYNQHCQWVQYNIPYWPNQDYNISGWWWRASYSCGGGNGLFVYGYSQPNFQGNVSYYYLGTLQPPVSQRSSNWTTCAVDNPDPGPPHGCFPGYQAFG